MNKLFVLMLLVLFSILFWAIIISIGGSIGAT